MDENMDSSVASNAAELAKKERIARTSALAAAAEEGRADEVARLLGAGAAPDGAGGGFASPLHACSGRECVEVLLAAGADPGIKTYFGRTAFMAAIIAGDEAKAKALLPVSNVAVADKEGMTALMLSVAKAGREWAARLVASGSNFAAASAEGETALMIAASAPSGEARVGLLLALGDRSFEERGADGGQALHYAARRGSPESVGMLLDAGADPSAVDGSGCAALLLAMSRLWRSPIQGDKLRHCVARLAPVSDPTATAGRGGLWAVAAECDQRDGTDRLAWALEATGERWTKEWAQGQLDWMVEAQLDGAWWRAKEWFAPRLAAREQREELAANVEDRAPRARPRFL